MPTIEITNLISVAEGRLMPGRLIEITNPLLPPKPSNPPAGELANKATPPQRGKRGRRKAVKGPTAHKAILAPPNDKEY